jgi:hypothetical protein
MTYNYKSLLETLEGLTRLTAKSHFADSLNPGFFMTRPKPASRLHFSTLLFDVFSFLTRSPAKFLLHIDLNSAKPQRLYRKFALSPTKNKLISNHDGNLEPEREL